MIKLEIFIVQACYQFDIKSTDPVPDSIGRHIGNGDVLYCGPCNNVASLREDAIGHIIADTMRDSEPTTNARLLSVHIGFLMIPIPYSVVKIEI